MRTSAAAALALALCGVTAPQAHADGLPLPVENSPTGVRSPGGAVRYLAADAGGRTMVVSQSVRGGRVRSAAMLRGRFAIPLVAYDGSAGGITADGRTLVVIRPRASFPRSATTFAVFDTRPRLRLRHRFTLPGDFSYDALSPDGRALFLINYLSARDPTRYRVRVYDLVRRRLDPKPIVDPREPPDAMNGLPMTRVTSRDGRWAYTLYDGAGKHPFIHALDTSERRAVCIDLRGSAFARDPGKLRLRLAGDGRLDVARKGGAVLATVDRRTFRVRAVAATAAKAGSGGGATQGLAAVLAGIAAALLVLAAGAHRLRVRRRVAT